MLSPFTERCRRPTTRPSALALSAAVTMVLIGTVAGGCGGTDGTGELNGMTRNPPNRVGDARLPQVNPASENRRGSLTGSDGGLNLVYFGFTSCPDVCPTTLADLRLALEELDEEERSRVQVSMVTVDPGRDSAKVLNGYLGHFFPRNRFSAFRTSDEGLLEEVEGRFGASHRIGRPDSEGDYDVSHTAQLYAVDEDGTVAVEWPFGSEPSAIASDLEQLLRQTAGGDRA